MIRLLGFALMACGPIADYKTPCGSSVYGATDIPETVTLTAFDAYVAGWSQGATCAALAGTAIHVRKEAAWVDRWGRKIAGAVYLDTGDIELGSDLAAYPHELAHLFEVRIDGIAPDESHESWVPRGIRRAESNARRIQ